MTEYEPILKQALEQAARGERPLATLELLRAFARRAEQAAKEAEDSWHHMQEKYPQLRSMPPLAEAVKLNLTKTPIDPYHMHNKEHGMAAGGCCWRKGQGTCQERKQIGTLYAGPGSNRCSTLQARQCEPGISPPSSR